LSSDEKLELPITKKIQPGILKVHDMIKKDGMMVVLDSTGEDFFIEIIDPDEEDNKPISILEDHYNHKIMWPFIVQQEFRDYFWIIDAFTPNIIHRIHLPDEGFMLQQFFIYDFRIYFVISSSVQKCHKLYSVDMR